MENCQNALFQITFKAEKNEKEISCVSLECLSSLQSKVVNFAPTDLQLLQTGTDFLCGKMVLILFFTKDWMFTAKMFFGCFGTLC